MEHEPITDSVSPGQGRGAIEVRDLRKTFRRRNGDEVVPVDNVSFTVAGGEFVVLLGPSGCGKTTLLRCIAGLEQPDAGEIELGGSTVFSSTRQIDQPPERRKASVVFQSYALWPHMTVRKNVAYPLRRRGLNRDDIEATVRSVLKMVGVDQLADQHPGQLSGGQQQRVALARALAAGNDVILFDEPLSNVDAKVRDLLRVELLAMQRDLGFAALYVTHDQTEAMELGHRIAVLREGHIEQLAPPSEVYRRPATSYVATFVGRTNQIGGTVEQADTATTRLKTPLGIIAAAGHPTVRSPGQRATVIFRPESVEVGPPGEVPDGNAWSATVETVIFGGPQVRLDVAADGKPLEVWIPSSRAVPQVGDKLVLRVDPANCWILDEDASELGAADDTPVGAT